VNCEKFSVNVDLFSLLESHNLIVHIFIDLNLMAKRREFEEKFIFFHTYVFTLSSRVVERWITIRIQLIWRRKDAANISRGHLRWSTVQIKKKINVFLLVQGLCSQSFPWISSILLSDDDDDNFERQGSPPPNEGSGLSHIRRRLMCPPLHGTLHILSDHKLQPPSPIWEQNGKCQSSSQHHRNSDSTEKLFFQMLGSNLSKPASTNNLQSQNL